LSYLAVKLRQGGYCVVDWPADRVERRPISAISPYSRNARTHSPAQIVQIAASISQWGWTVPVLIDERGELIAGHARIEAAKSIGLTEAPVMVARGWSDEQKRAYVLADNKLALNAAWDDVLLGEELKALSASAFDISLIGFPQDELANLLKEPDFAPVGEDEQGRLDQRAAVTCPHCGHSFSPP
jgi:ParB-like chromosome segregation protein Spo0J